MSKQEKKLIPIDPYDLKDYVGKELIIIEPHFGQIKCKVLMGITSHSHAVFQDWTDIVLRSTNPPIYIYSKQDVLDYLNSSNK